MDNRSPARGFNRQRDSSATSDISRGIGGSKISYNSGAIKMGKDTYDANGEKLFAPKINERSRMMSPRDRDTTFQMLHMQAVNQQRKQQIKSYQA